MVDVKINTHLGQYNFVNCKRLTVAKALILKSKTGSLADQSCDGCPAVWIIKSNLNFLNNTSKVL